VAGIRVNAIRNNLNSFFKFNLIANCFIFPNL